MRTVVSAVLFVFLIPGFSFSQSISGVYKIDALIQRIENKDTTYVVNFWATWCKPCVEELPAFDSLSAELRGSHVKIILVSLDFKEDLQKKVNPFLYKHHIKSDCVLLDEVNGNNFIDKISPEWSGTIPATLMKLGDSTVFLEKKLKLHDLKNAILGLVKK